MLRGGRRDQVGRVLPAQPDRERERGPGAVRLGREPGQQLLPLRAEQDGRIGVHRLEASPAAVLLLHRGAVTGRPPGEAGYAVASIREVDTLPCMSDGGLVHGT